MPEIIDSIRTQMFDMHMITSTKSSLKAMSGFNQIWQDQIKVGPKIRSSVSQSRNIALKPNFTETPREIPQQTNIDDVFAQ